MRTGLACALLAGTIIAGCGGSPTPAPIAPSDAARLRQEVAAIRAAAAAQDPDATHAAAASLRADVQRLMNDGRLSAADGQPMLVVAAQADSRITAEVHSPVPPAETGSPTGPLATPPAPGHDHGHGHHGHGGGDGGD
jgi:hypothetical protein